MKKLCSIVLSLAIIGILSFGLNNSVEILQSAHGDYPAPQKPGLTYTHGDHGGSPSYGHADTPAPQA
ncbi:Phr family secreted Rap phosphatase inhibitor [Bacillus cereus group sp. BfR-BA-01380]|uniref:Phr family secreted Rap phosphatase inhibitor n=1 Tax=Bacillus cereus group sp. BfR-BA-01380 TaxID=2920324 RepID=UPI001F5777D8|nr:Phr family secreted Rap phosphatase inhibitor [Bacillus cereus group sp. BfR-BA-01380]